MKTLFTSLVLASSALALNVNAETKTFSFDTDKFYAGGGLNYNRIDSFTGTDGKANGYQIFAGYEYGQRSGFDIAAEVGLLQTEEFYSGSNVDADSIWGSAVATRPLPEIDAKLSAVARAGIALDGDDGLFLGFGAQYQVKANIFVRAEYLNKDLTQSYQVNAAYQF